MLAFSRVKGRFTQVHGTILYDPAAPANSSVTAIIEANSLEGVREVVLIGN